MAVSKQSGHDSVSTATSGVASQTVNVITTGDQCGIIFAATYANAGASVFTTATIGGTSAPAVASGEASEPGTEPGNVKAYFLDGITQGAATAFTVSRTNNAVVGILYCISFAANGPCEIYTPGIVLLQGTGSYAEQLVESNSPTNALRCACAYYGGASPAPTGANTNSIGSNDQTAFGTSAGFEAVGGTGSRLVGFTQVTADDRAAVHVAVREIPAQDHFTFQSPNRMPLGA